MLTASNLAVFIAVTVCEVTAMPANNVPERLRVTLDPGMAVQVLPSLEVKAVKVVPLRCTSR